MVSLIICTLDESASIAGVLHEASQVLAHCSHEIIVVDDSADERTADVVRDFGASRPWVRVLRRQGARGLASAAIAGWDAARGVRLAICDGDGQHDLQQLPAMLAQMDAGADLVAASRYIDGDTGLSWTRSAMSRIATWATTTLLVGGLTDPMSGFFAMTRPTYEAARPRLSGVGFKILVDVVASSPRRLRMAETPAVLRTREHGMSKLDLRVVADLGALLIEKRTRGLIPVRLAMFGAVGLTGVAVHMAVLSVLHLALPFWLAQIGAILSAMSWNFWINNILTFRDVRLRGAAMWRGVLAFYVACLGGGLISEALATLLHNEGVNWMASGVAGALAAGLWNYYASRRGTWGVGRSARPQPAAIATADPLTTND